MKSSILITSLILFMSCWSVGYRPDGLRKLSDEEIIERSTKTYPPNNEIVVKDRRGSIISRDSINRIKYVDKYTTDVYVDPEGRIRELVIRKAEPSDYERREIVNRNKRKAYEENQGVYEVEVSCENLEEQLIEIGNSDQQIRSTPAPTDINQDLKNISEVVSILGTCDSVNDLSAKAKYSAWLVIQHSPLKFQKRYIKLFKQWAGEGDLSLKNILMMEDRILVEQGLPQIYGTQVEINEETGIVELYEVRDWENLNKRRKEMGFEPIEIYLERFKNR